MRQLTTGEDVRTQPPCRCTYGLYRVPDAPGPWVPVNRPGIRRPEWLTACFRIAQDCPHHGDVARYWVDDPLWDLTLTDDSERGHDA